MLDQIAVPELQTLLATRRERLLSLSMQRANLDRSDTLYFQTVAEITKIRRIVAELKAELRARGETVEDELGDDPTTPADADCPYPGMVPFGQADAARFYGRAAIVLELVQQLRVHPLLTIIGASGSGKSSLVFAGLVPALQERKLLGTGAWQVRALRPDAEPMHELADALGSDASSAAVAALLASSPTSRVLLVVDALEELFTITRQQHPEQIEPFLAALAQLATIPHCYVLLTVRADFYADLMACSLWPDIRAHRCELAPLTTAELSEAIRRPAEAQLVEVEEALVQKLLADAQASQATQAANAPGILPFIQETLVELWTRMEQGTLTLRAYQAMGDGERTGLQVALARRAQAAFAALDDRASRDPDHESPQQIIARRVLLRLVQFGEGHAPTRRQQPLAALRAASDEPSLFSETVRHMCERRLLTLDGNEREAECKADIAHEALLHGWPLLRGWLTTRRADEQCRRVLEGKAAEWVRLGRGAGGLLDAAELSEADAWLGSAARSDLGASDDLLALAAASRAAINPGWHRWGAAGLGVAGVAGAALLAWMYLIIRTIQSPALRLVIWVLVIGGLVWGGLVSGLIRRSTTYPGQRLSYLVGQQRIMQGGIVILTTVSVMLWILFGIQWVKDEAYCGGEKGFTRSAVQDRIAVLNVGTARDNIDVTWLVFSQFPGVIQAWIVNEQDIKTCHNYFSHIVELKDAPSAGKVNNEVSYIMKLQDLQSEASVTLREIGRGCGHVEYLARSVVKQMKPKLGMTLEKGDGVPPEHCEAYLRNQEGYAALTSKNYEVAEQKFQKALQIEQNIYPLAHYNLGLVYNINGNYSKALSELEQSIKLSRNTYAPYLSTIGTLYQRKGDYVQAEHYIHQAIQDDPRLTQPYYALAVVYVYSEPRRCDEANIALNKAEEQIQKMNNMNAAQDERFQLQKNRGLVAFCKNDNKDVINLLEPLYQEITLSYAQERITDDQKRYEEVIVYHLANSYQEQGRSTIACQRWQRYTQIGSSKLIKEEERRQNAPQRMQLISCSS